jgi:hypothetical protein
MDVRRVNLVNGVAGSNKSGDNLEAVNVALKAAEGTLLMNGS